MVQELESVFHAGRELADVMALMISNLDLSLSRRLRWLVHEKAVRRIIFKYVARGIKAEEIDSLIDYAVRCRISMAHREPVPRYSPPED